MMIHHFIKLVFYCFCNTRHLKKPEVVNLSFQFAMYTSFALLAFFLFSLVQANDQLFKETPEEFTSTETTNSVPNCYLKIKESKISCFNETNFSIPKKLAEIELNYTASCDSFNNLIMCIMGETCKSCEKSPELDAMIDWYHDSVVFLFSASKCKIPDLKNPCAPTVKPNTHPNVSSTKAVTQPVTSSFSLLWIIISLAAAVIVIILCVMIICCSCFITNKKKEDEEKLEAGFKGVLVSTRPPSKKTAKGKSKVSKKEGAPVLGIAPKSPVSGIVKSGAVKSNLKAKSSQIKSTAKSTASKNVKAQSTVSSNLKSKVKSSNAAATSSGVKSTVGKSMSKLKQGKSSAVMMTSMTTSAAKSKIVKVSSAAAPTVIKVRNKSSDLPSIKTNAAKSSSAATRAKTRSKMPASLISKNKV